MHLELQGNLNKRVGYSGVRLKINSSLLFLILLVGLSHRKKLLTCTNVIWVSSDAHVGMKTSAESSGKVIKESQLGAM